MDSAGEIDLGLEYDTWIEGDALVVSAEVEDASTVNEEAMVVEAYNAADEVDTYVARVEQDNSFTEDSGDYREEFNDWYLSEVTYSRDEVAMLAGDFEV